MGGAWGCGCLSPGCVCVCRERERERERESGGEIWGDSRERRVGVLEPPGGGGDRVQKESGAGTWWVSLPATALILLINLIVIITNTDIYFFCRA